MARAIAVVALALAIVASVFAIWPVVADAPWQDDAAPVIENRSDEIRCQGALDYRTAVLTSPPTRAGTILGGTNTVAITDKAALQQLLDTAESEIARYC